MTTYAAITSGQRAVGAPLTFQIAEQWTNNLLAVQEGDASAPNIQGGALAVASVPTSAMISYPWSQADINSNAIGQTELKTASQEQSIFLNLGASRTITLAGGYWTLGSQFRHSSSANSMSGEIKTSAAGTSYAGMNVRLTNLADVDGSTMTGYVTSYYLTSSPPYSLGYGDIELFIFLLIDNATAKIEATYVAPEAPWHYNGKTDITPNHYDDNGKPIKRMKLIQWELIQSGKTITQAINSAILGGQSSFDAIMDRYANDGYVYLDINQDYKNRDMPDIPHPFINQDLTNKTVAVLNPQSSFVKRLSRLNKNIESYKGFSFAEEFFYNNRLIIGNSFVENNGGFDASVKCVDARLK